MRTTTRGIILALLCHGLCEADNLRSSSQHRRRLSEEPFISYEPYTLTTDHAAIDLDQKAMEIELARGTDDGLDAALSIYQEGAFSKSYAEITLTEPLQVDVLKGVTVIGRTTDGRDVRGKMAGSFDTGDSIIQVQYSAGSVQESWTECHVGANPNPETRGCFAPTGSLEIGELGLHTYSYNPLRHNYNARTIQGFSTQAKDKMYDCEMCPYRTYAKFYDYYGEHDYGNKYILAAFNRGATNFARGNAVFSSYSTQATTEVTKRGTVLLNVWMYVIRELEDAVDDCSSQCPIDGCNDDQVNAWDTAVAFYTGSIPKATGQGGVLLYSLAQSLCRSFGTCLTQGLDVGTARVNREIFQQFHLGQARILEGNCNDARLSVSKISELMAVPLIQGTLRYAYKMDMLSDNRERTEAEGATFAAAVLPLVHACNTDDAATIYNNMRVGNGGTASFSVVKTAFERNYDCLGVTCEDVGGMVNLGGDGYLPEAGKCVATQVASSRNGP
ncbi:expressed unknown protein [Seminavis robusta]|uniref:Uncharacterized protein n=1 Tax=Seminavis robusta TaxID=568900 RepID=A0A9N8ER30_9STRA|nr:expressed unknown protein [Seminavis robusta]|eukprot:Sro1839_g300900.1 n/a (501) ;mRNA; f:10016-11771